MYLSDNRPFVIGDHDLTVKLQILERADLGPDIVYDAQTADTFKELFLFELVQRAGHDTNANPAFGRADQPFDDHHILITLVLQPQRFRRAIDEIGNALAAVVGTPDQL